MNADKIALLTELLDDPEILRQAHIAVEDVAIEMRDSRSCVLGPANGIVVKEFDGSPSDVIRIGTRTAIKIAVEGIIKYLETNDSQE